MRLVIYIIALIYFDAEYQYLYSTNTGDWVAGLGLLFLVMDVIDCFYKFQNRD